MAPIDYSVIKDLLSEKRKILITSHVNPDGDALGSCLAMYHFLVKMGHETSVMLPNDFPDFLEWMPAAEKIMICDADKIACTKLFQEADIIFSLDYNAPSRLGLATEAFKASTAIKIMIDHHTEPQTHVYNHVYSTKEVSSTSELIFDLIQQCGPELLDLQIAECIYTGIMTDTGSFSYACNYEKTFRIVAELYKAGIDGVAINRLVYSTFSESRLRLLGYALSKKLEVLPEFSTAYISLTLDELKRYQFKVGDTEGLVNYALSIKGIRFAILFTEREDKIRLSLRSAGNFSVNDFARKHFEGGGHMNAAGGDSFESMDKTIEKFVRLLPEYNTLLSPEAKS